MFEKILCANDGSERAAHALELAIAIAKANGSELHMVSVEEIDYMPEFIEEVREEVGTAARRFHKVLQDARQAARAQQIDIRTHVLTGHAVRDIVLLATELKSDLLVIGSNGHSRFYERMLGSRAERLVNLAPCPVLVVK
ncbi:MAG: universal stress protein [Xanthobacteraceae bacterium]|nr:universal stress protein [Xanthobacteraceae bacterium]